VLRDAWQRFGLEKLFADVPQLCPATVFRGNGAGSTAHYFVGTGAWGTA
jgi:hypothetical protein